MPGLSDARVLWVEREPGLVRYDVLCQYCNGIHHHQWLGADTRFSVVAPCSPAQRYRVRLAAVLASRPNRDDNAINVPVPNWTE